MDSESGEWRVESGEWRVESGEWRVESGEWRVESGEWRVESGEWRVESGEWRVESGEWRVESGEWRVESGEWRVESGEWRVESVEWKESAESGESRMERVGSGETGRLGKLGSGECGEWGVGSGESGEGGESGESGESWEWESWEWGVGSAEWRVESGEWVSTAQSLASRNVASLDHRGHAIHNRIHHCAWPVAIHRQIKPCKKKIREISGTFGVRRNNQHRAGAITSQAGQGKVTKHIKKKAPLTAFFSSQTATGQRGPQTQPRPRLLATATAMQCGMRVAFMHSQAKTGHRKPHKPVKFVCVAAPTNPCFALLAGAKVAEGKRSTSRLTSCKIS